MINVVLFAGMTSRIGLHGAREDEDTEDEDADMAQSEDNGRYDFCEVCEEQMLAVFWFSDSFQNPSDNRRLYSACPTCRSRLGLQGTP